MHDRAQTIAALWERLPDQVAALAGALLAVMIALLASRALARIIGELVATGHLGPQMALRLQYARRWGLGVITLLVLLQVSGLFAHAWALLSAMLAAVAIGFFAAWSILSNATSALILLTFRPFRIGDRIELLDPTNNTAFAGVVTDMNLMFTVLSDFDPETGAPATLHIPNNLFLQKLVRTAGAARPSQVVAPPFFSQPPMNPKRDDPR
jgi:small-conductance mechanosensitive channel